MVPDEFKVVFTMLQLPCDSPDLSLYHIIIIIITHTTVYMFIIICALYYVDIPLLTNMIVIII